MELPVVENEPLQPILFDCGKIRGSILDDNPFVPTAPTYSYSLFLQNLRDLAKHPTRVTLGVSELPSEEDITKLRLPLPDLESDSEFEAEPVYETRGEGSRGGKGNKGGRGKTASKWDRKKSNNSKKLRAYFLAYMEMDGQHILLLFERLNLYLLAVRDAKKTWWEFSLTGGKLFADIKGLGVEENYVGLEIYNKTVLVGRNQIMSAFYTFADPSNCNVNEIKMAAQIMISITSEGARIVSLGDEFGDALNDASGNKQIKLGGMCRVLVRAWEKVSKILLKNSHAVDKTINDFLKDKKDEELTKELKKRGMDKLGNASRVYGLLLSIDEEK